LSIEWVKVLHVGTERKREREGESEGLQNILYI
jgi:hypothetical protein